MSDNPTDVTIHILRDIQERLGALKDVPERMGRIEIDLVEMRREMRERHDNLVSIFGGAHRDHERRLTALEVRVDGLDPPRGRRR